MVLSSVRIEHVEPRSVAVIRRTITNHDFARIVPELCGRVWTHLRQHGIQGGHNVAIYYTGGVRLEAGVEVATPFVESDDVVRSEIPAGMAATATLFGPYSGLPAVHGAIQSFCREHGHRMSEPCWEIYGHWQREWDADASLIRTDVYSLVSPGS